MAKRNNNRNQPNTRRKNKATDTEFGGELTQSKKARKEQQEKEKIIVNNKNEHCPICLQFSLVVPPTFRGKHTLSKFLHRKNTFSIR